jgi:hypothetical protein
MLPNKYRNFFTLMGMSKSSLNMKMVSYASCRITTKPGHGHLGPTIPDRKSQVWAMIGGVS